MSPIQPPKKNTPSVNMLVGVKLRELRRQKKLSLRNLSDLTGLNINTLSMIENGKISPSVSTLQRLAISFDVTISVFFEETSAYKQVIYTRGEKRKFIFAEGAKIENLMNNILRDNLQAYIIALEPGYSSGERHIQHDGYEFVYCIDGKFTYTVNDEEYSLTKGDSLMFDSHLHHCWLNPELVQAKFLLMILPVSMDEKNKYDHFNI
jgi:transcriptional regulator with XRE-family HTH domain